MRRKVFLVALLFALILAGQFVLMNQRLLKTKRTLSSRLKKYRREQRALMFALNKYDPYQFSLPKEFGNAPYLDGDVILGVKAVEIRNVFAPYNGSLIERFDGGYHLFFRYDLIHQMHFNAFNTHIGCVDLDEQFNQTDKEFTKIQTHSIHSEDPRALRLEDNLYLVYNDGPFRGVRGRKMHIALLDERTLQLSQITKLYPEHPRIEKNWVPFVHNDTIHFEYQISSPRKILRLEDPAEPTLLQTFDSPSESKLRWETQWGTLLGGSSARLVDGEYLAFFHSKFTDSLGIPWYVMGAYTFEATPPFRMTALSKAPILYKGIYQTECLNTADPQKFVVFPGGYAIEKREGKTLIHLACGENDCQVKILTFDKDRLLETLDKVESSSI